MNAKSKTKNNNNTRGRIQGRNKRKIDVGDKGGAAHKRQKQAGHPISPISQSPETQITLNFDIPGALGTSLFPPTLYTHVRYSNGICLQKITQSPDSAASSSTVFNALVPANYVNATYTKSRSFFGATFPKPRLWSHRHTAQEAARSGVASNAFRLLGTMKRIVAAVDPPPREKINHTVGFPIDQNKRAKITRTQAKAQAKIELNNMGCRDYAPMDLEQRADEISSEWASIWSPENMPRTLHSKHGHLLPGMVNDPYYVPLHSIIHKWYFSECNPPLPVQLYNGLREIDIRLPLVLKSLAELQLPEESLYKTPLILTYPRIIPFTQTSRYAIEIAVYAHRLLPEVLTACHLHRVMTALDKGSFRMTRSLHLPPQPTNPSFASSPSPKLTFGCEEIPEAPSNEVGKAEKAERGTQSDKQPTIDLTIQDSTRTNNETLSAFSIPGLLKMWENTGNDTSNWSQIHSQLVALPFKKDLMIHQQHGVCWMLQMESLGGFGINSILWEEREWSDGGKYYYSPALGQVRLAQPPTVHGGILSDEMGLGKTIMVLGLIVATIHQLKEDKNRMHTTLIIVPPTLVAQWLDEIQAATQGRLSVQFYDDRSHEFTPKYNYPPDICISTYNALVRNGKRSRNMKCLLKDYKWGRIVLDEMQEIRSSTSSIAKAADGLDSPRRWMLSGTPLFDGIGDLRGELNFLSLEPYAAKSEDGFFDFSITEHWRQQSMHALDTLSILGLLILRRSKSMTLVSSGEPIMGLKPMIVEFVPISQSPCERALYCFLEYVVARELEECKLEVGKASTSRRFCLRLLRELCISPMLLSGGLGANSQLVKLNNLLVKYNRLHLEQNFEDKSGAKRVLSCVEAIRYLSQISKEVSTSEDFISGIKLGDGGGISKRNRANTNSVVERLEACRMKLARSQLIVRKAKSAKARAYWHLALEKITMGHFLPHNTLNPSMSSLWKWRAIVCKKQNRRALKLPTFLSRGWRPSEEFLNRDLLAAHPDFVWLYPGALALHGIPREVTLQELTHTISKTVKRSTGIKVIPINHCVQREWRAIVQFTFSEDARTLAELVVKGVVVQTSFIPSFVQNELVRAQAAYNESRNLNNVFPTPEGTQRVKRAKLEMMSAERGLLILLDDDKYHESKHIKLRRANLESRSLHPCMATSLYKNKREILQIENQHLITHSPIIKEQLKFLRNLERASEISESVQQMSAFESLEAMSMKEWDKASCAICLGHLGSADPMCSDDTDPGEVVLTGCSHLYCTKCVMDLMSSTLRDRLVQCPACRKELIQRDFVFINPRLSRDDEKIEIEKRSKAKAIIQKAGKMLEESNGQLDKDIWYQLYFAIDVPHQVSQRGDPRLSAIPKDLIAFFRAATCMVNVNNSANIIPTLGHGHSSKIQALLRDLPEDERSVVFTSSNTAVKHLMAVLETYGISFRALYTGQNHSVAEKSVETWRQSNIDKEGNVRFSARVLIVQAGAAASGLTLTAACKMFFLEPFVRQEEEAQAFARCHRFGQVDSVRVKVYFSPVSVESRLLEWRKLAKSSGPQDTKVVYTDFDYGHNDEKKEENFVDEQSGDDLDDMNQTLFLLGLNELN